MLPHMELAGHCGYFHNTNLCPAPVRGWLSLKEYFHSILYGPKVCKTNPVLLAISVDYRSWKGQRQDRLVQGYRVGLMRGSGQASKSVPDIHGSFSCCFRGHPRFGEMRADASGRVAAGRGRTGPGNPILGPFLKKRT